MAELKISLQCLKNDKKIYITYYVTLLDFSALKDIPYKNNKTEAGDHDIKPERLLPGNC